MDNRHLEKRYGLFTAICMVVGIVIGSGVFFKAQDILRYVGGNMLLGVLAWIIGGTVMIACAFNFANFATKYVKVNGIVDYAEAIVGEKYAYMMAWFISTIYYPAMTAVLAWVSARYTIILFDAKADTASGLCIALGALYLCLAYVINILAPKIAGKFQVSSTVIKLIPLLIVTAVGTVVGLFNGNTAEAFAHSTVLAGDVGFSSVFSGIAAAAFAYEGWIIATSINAELKNPKRNLPLALVIGTLIIMIVYILYFIGLAGGASVETLQAQGSTAAIRNLFGRVGGTVLNVFVVVSCLGTLNGLMLASTRSFYSIAVRGQGLKPEVFSELDRHTNMPTNSGVVSIGICALWFFYFYAANLTKPIFGLFSFDSSELPIITIYGLYIPIFITYIFKEYKKHSCSNAVLKNLVMPALAAAASLFMVFVAVYAHGVRPYLTAKENGNFAFPVLFYLIVFLAVMAIGLFFYRKRSK